MAEAANLDTIKDQLRRLDVLSGLAGSKAGDADLAALCEQIAFNDVADLVGEVERLRPALAERDGIWYQAIAERDASRAEAERLRAALERVKTDEGKVCATFEICRHVACQSSVSAWMIADAALKGETPGESNERAPHESALPKDKEWWIERARREPDSAMGVGCLCLYAIEQVPGEPIKHDPRCVLALGPPEER